MNLGLCLASEIKTSSGCISPTESQGKSWQSSRLSSDELITSTQRPGGGKEERSSSVSREHISMAANIRERHGTDSIHPVARGHQLSAPRKASVKEKGNPWLIFLSQRPGSCRACNLYKVQASAES